MSLNKAIFFCLFCLSVLPLPTTFPTSAFVLFLQTQPCPLNLAVPEPYLKRHLHIFLFWKTRFGDPIPILHFRYVYI